MICFKRVRDDFDQEEFEYLAEFQAHSKTFDVVSSHEISETVTGIEWLNNGATTRPQLLVANERCIKLFRVQNKQTRKTESIAKRLKNAKGFAVPKSTVTREHVEGKPVASFSTR